MCRPLAASVGGCLTRSQTHGASSRNWAHSNGGPILSATNRDVANSAAAHREHSKRWTIAMSFNLVDDAVIANLLEQFPCREHQIRTVAALVQVIYKPDGPYGDKYLTSTIAKWNQKQKYCCSWPRSKRKDCCYWRRAAKAVRALRFVRAGAQICHD